MDGAPAVVESLKIIIACYERLGMADLADSTRQVLKESYPEAAAPPPERSIRWYQFWRTS